MADHSPRSWKLLAIRQGFCMELSKIDDQLQRVNIANGIAAIDEMLSWTVL